MRVLKTSPGLTREEYSSSKQKKRSLDDQTLNSQEFIPWNEDASPSTSTLGQASTKTPALKIPKPEPVAAMETYSAGDFDNPSNVDDENDNKETGDEGNAVFITYFLLSSDLFSFLRNSSRGISSYDFHF